MSGRHQPEAGADSEHIHQYTVEHEGFRICECGHLDPEGPQPMLELPRPDLNVVRSYLRQQGVPENLIESEANKVVMADSLGRAIHAARGTDPWPPECAAYAREAVDPPATWVEPVPYGHDNCGCEAMGLHLVQLMAAQAAMDNTKAAARIIVPGTGRRLQ